MRSAAILVALALTALAVDNPKASTVTVAAGGDLQAALDGARPGDTVLLTPGATYSGNFVLPAGSGPDESRVITVRTAGEGLPAAGTRMTPEAAGPLAKIQSPNDSPALRTAPGARGWRVELVEFRANRDGVGDIIALGDGSNAQRTVDQAPSNLALDRLYIHGDPDSGQKRGIALNSAAATITGCYISDIKAVGQDSQAIAGWNGPGGYVIENNYLEAAGENIMFGGADPAIMGLTPTTITVRGNVLNKPMAWHDSPKWQVKNLFELKNARAVVIERNVLQHSWQQAQSGYAVLFTVRNQDGGCAWCQVEDVQFRSNVITGVAAGFQITGVDNNHPSRQTNHIVISDNLLDGIDSAAWGGDGYVMAFSEGPRDITFDHNTVVQGESSGILKLSPGPADAVALTNNILSHGAYGIIGQDHGVGNDSIKTYLPGARVTGNVIAGGSSNQYPPGNLFPSVNDFHAQFVNFGARNYHLVARSGWAAAGTDGRDLGANLAALPAVPRNR